MSYPKMLGVAALGLTLLITLGFFIHSYSLKNKSGELNIGPSGEEVGPIDGGPQKESLSEKEIARRRVALRAIIRKGDYYQARNEAIRSIQYYEQAHREIPVDTKIAVRLASAYMEVRQFSKAAKVFAALDLADLSEPVKQQAIESVMLDSGPVDKNAAILRMNIKPETREYLKVMVVCSERPLDCIDTIDKSLSKNVHIQTLQTTIRNAKNTSSDPLFIEALVLGKLFENRAFLAVKNLARTILDRRPDYRVVQKIAGYASFELGEYKAAAAMLESYYQANTSDTNIAYMLGIVNFFKEDYATSNLYFNAAVLAGYTPKLELERRLIYNYVLLGDTSGAFKVFRHLLGSEEASSQDFIIALYMSELAGESSKSKLWANKGVQKFPLDPELLTFASISELRSGEPIRSEELLNKALLLDPKNPMALLEKSSRLLALQDYDSARAVAQEVIAQSPVGYFANEAQKMLALIAKSISGNLTATGSISQ